MMSKYTITVSYRKLSVINGKLKGARKQFYAPDVEIFVHQSSAGLIKQHRDEIRQTALSLIIDMGIPAVDLKEHTTNRRGRSNKKTSNKQLKLL